MKRFVSLFLACLMFWVGTVAVSAEGIIAGIAQPLQSDDNLPIYSRGREHSYDAGIVDGGVYRIHNIWYGVYLEASGGSGQEGTPIVTNAALSTGNSQLFMVSYLGHGIYEIKPYGLSTVLHMDGDNVVSRAKTRSDQQRFDLRMVESGTALIYTGASGYSKTICCSDGSSNAVTQQVYDTLDDPLRAEWQFERVNTYTYDFYHKYYVRNVRTGVYLDVQYGNTTDGTLVHTHSFLGQVNQEWKLVYDDDNYCYYFKAGHRRDMALDLGGDHAVIRNDGSISAQGMKLFAVGVDENGFKTYQIKTQNNTKYLNVGNPLSDNDAVRAVVNGEDSTDLWVLEEVVVDGQDLRPATVNQWGTHPIFGTNYGDVKYVTFRTEVSSRYKIEVYGGNAIAATVYAGPAKGEVLNGYPRSGIGADGQTTAQFYVLDVFFEPGATYYVPVVTTGTANADFYIRIRQFTATYHVGPNTEAGNMSPTAQNILNPSESMNLNISLKEGMTAARAAVEINSLTGYRDFNSEIFVYIGHGETGIASYSNELDDTAFNATDLPDMSNCELAVWMACLSGVSSANSLANVSVARGAKTVLGWSGSPYIAHGEVYMLHLFRGLAMGYTVFQAAQYAISKNNFSDADVIASSLVPLGDLNNVVFPIETTSSQSENSAVTTSTYLVEANFDHSKYTLVRENEALGVKLYSKMINDIPSDDYFMEFYTDGVLTNIVKSDYTMSLEDELLATEQAGCVAMSTNAAGQNKSDDATCNRWFKYVDGEFRLVEKRMNDDNICGCCEVTYYDVKTGGVLE